MREKILDVLARGELVVGDGAMGTMLQLRGLPAGQMPEVWNEEKPDAIRGVHRAYLEAGAQILTTNTFGSNRIRLGEAHLEQRAGELSELGVALARQVAEDRAWVAASVGPTGQLMAPLGPLSPESAEQVFGQQIEGLLQGQPDLILIETQHDVEEACCAIRAARARTDLAVFCTFAFNRQGRTMMGLRPEVAATRAAKAGADVVGANCGDGPEAIAAALAAMKGATDLPLMAQANAGIPQMDGEAGTHWDVGPEEMAQHATQFVTLGARIVGGCCGTGPAHISALVRALKEGAT